MGMAWATFPPDVLRYPRLWRQYKRSRARAKEVRLSGMMSLRLRKVVLLAGRVPEAGAQGRTELPGEAGAYLPAEAGVGLPAPLSWILLAGAEVEVGVEAGTTGGTGLLAEVGVAVVAEGASGVEARVRVRVAQGS